MDFETENTYEEFFDKMHSSEGTRNLRQIFEDDDKPLQSESNNLRYQPHKDTPVESKHKAKTHSSGARTKATDSKSLDTWSTVVAKVANAYNGSEHVGRVGVALSRNGAGAAKLVIYKSRNHLLSTLLLTKSITTSVPRDNATNLILRESYMQFYDDEQRFWSLRFELTSDEEEFTEELLNLGLPIDQMEGKDSKCSSARSNATPTSPVTPVPQTLPKPMPRQKLKTTTAEAAAAAGDEEQDARSSYDSESESTQSTEDNLTTQRAAVVINNNNSKALVPVATSSSLLSETRRSNKLEVYLDEQRATGHAMDKKMDTILQAMCRLTSGHHMQFSEADSAAEQQQHQQQQQQGVKKMDSMLMQAMGRLNNSSAQQLNESITATDNEDELLELEQKLLDFKKQNRVLIKSLKSREQALAELRASTCALCEELLSQNNDLKKQNTALVTAMSSQLNGESSVPSLTATSDSCSNCEKYVCKINALERRVNVLQNALLNFPNLSSSVSTSAASMKAASPP